MRDVDVSSLTPSLPLENPRSSFKRLALSFFMDFGIANAAIAALLFIFLHREALLFEAFIAFLIVEVIGLASGLRTPGGWALGILKYFDDGEKRYAYRVEAGISRFESWGTMILAYLFFSDGVKTLTRLHQLPESMPFFGSMMPLARIQPLMVVLATASIATSLFLYRMSKKGYFAALLLQLIAMVDFYFSAALMPNFIEELAKKRGGLSGSQMGVDPEVIRSSLINTMWAYYAIMALLLLAAGRRYLGKSKPVAAVKAIA
jgi:hypothetical protein